MSLLLQPGTGVPDEAKHLSTATPPHRAADEGTADTPLLLMLVSDAEDVTEVRQAVAGVYRVQIRRTPELLLDAIRCGLPKGVIIGASGRGKPGVAMMDVDRFTRVIHSLFGAIPVFAYLTAGCAQGAPLGDGAAALDGHFAVLPRGAPDLCRLIEARLGRAQWPELLDLFRADLDLLTSAAAREFCANALATGGSAWRAVSSVAGTERPRLAIALRECGLRSERWFLKRVRLLVAAHLLRAPGRCMEDVALALEFPTGDALRRALSREIGGKPSTVSRDMLFQVIASVLRRAIRGESIARRVPGRAEGT